MIPKKVPYIRPARVLERERKINLWFHDRALFPRGMQYNPRYHVIASLYNKRPRTGPRINSAPLQPGTVRKHIEEREMREKDNLIAKLQARIRSLEEMVLEQDGVIWGIGMDLTFLDTRRAIQSVRNRLADHSEKAWPQRMPS